jgi:uncharacterized protein
MRYLITIFILLSTVHSFSQKKPINPFVKLQPVPHRAVNDFDKFLTASERDSLEKELAGIHVSQKSHPVTRMAVLT